MTSVLRRTLLLLFVFLSVSIWIVPHQVAADPDDGGGVACIACTLIVSLMEQYAAVHEASIVETVKNGCSLLPKGLSQPCDVFIMLFGKQIIESLEQSLPADDVCAKIRLCTNPQCRLFPKRASVASETRDAVTQRVSISVNNEPSTVVEKRVKKVVEDYMARKRLHQRRRHRMMKHAETRKEFAADRITQAQQKALLTSSGFGYLVNKFMVSLKRVAPSNSIWDEIMKKIEKVTEDHLPLVDLDGDTFASHYGLRGAAWRGRDCNELDNSIYPGRRATKHSPATDHNCNGISGSSPSGESYEELFCEGTGQRGTIIIGDSATAHFRIPEQWLTAKDINSKLFTHTLGILENELDWPQLSWSTGFASEDQWNLTPGPIDSFYLRMRQRNRCNHRDYQNIGVNGARTGAMIKMATTVARNKTTDHPAIVFYAPIGNDVCTPHHTVDRFTKPEQFYSNVLSTVQHLNKTLPDGSAIVFLGLVDGRILFDTLHNATHPIGTTYSRIYDYLNCLQNNPCWGWLNSNSTIRDMTSAHAKLLSEQYKKLIADWQPRVRIPMIYYDFPLDVVRKQYEAAGGIPAELIEPVDGFHPSQVTQALLGGYLYEAMASDHPELLGPVNPHNERIDVLFGEQGGY